MTPGSDTVRWEESSDSTGPIFIPRRRGAARRRSRRRAGPPTTGNENWARGVTGFFPPYIYIDELNQSINQSIKKKL